MSNESYDLFKVGMTVYRKTDLCPMEVIMFFMDDFNDRFCDRMECFYYDNQGNKKTAIYNYEDVNISGLPRKNS